jgi:glutaredoxin
MAWDYGHVIAAIEKASAGRMLFLVASSWPSFCFWKIAFSGGTYPSESKSEVDVKFPVRKPWFCWNSLSGVAKLRLVSAMRQVVMYSRKGCHLCEIVKETLSKLQRRGGFVWSEIDVDSDEQLRRQFTDEVPVIFIDGRKAFKYRLDEREFLRKLAS